MAVLESAEITLGRRYAIINFITVYVNIIRSSMLNLQHQCVRHQEEVYLTTSLLRSLKGQLLENSCCGATRAIILSLLCVGGQVS